MFPFPYGNGFLEQGPPFARERESAIALIGFIHGDLDQPAALKRFQIGGQGCAVHRKQLRHAADRRRLGPIERHQKRELAVGQCKRAERIVEAAGEGARGALHMQAQACVTHTACHIEAINPIVNQQGMARWSR